MTTGISASQVGDALGVSADTVRRHWSRWVAERGFPRPLFDDGLLRWDAGAVAEWKRRRTDGVPSTGTLEPDWAAIARKRGAALDAGRDPDVLAA